VILIEMLDVRTDAVAIIATNYRRGKIHACFRTRGISGCPSLWSMSFDENDDLIGIDNEI